jgi:hypothetical protein
MKVQLGWYGVSAKVSRPGVTVNFQMDWHTWAQLLDPEVGNSHGSKTGGNHRLCRAEVSRETGQLVFGSQSKFMPLTKPMEFFNTMGAVGFESHRQVC